MTAIKLQGPARTLCVLSARYAPMMLTDKEADEIRRGLAAGMRGPVILKWFEQLLADRDERVAQERTRPHAWPGPLDRLVGR